MHGYVYLKLFFLWFYNLFFFYFILQDGQYSKEILKMLEENAIERHTLRQMFKDTLEKLEQYA